MCWSSSHADAHNARPSRRMILFVVFSWLLCSCAYGGRVFDPNKAEIAPDTSRDIGEALDLQQRNRVEQKMLECWTKPTGLFLYSDEACALAWKYTVRHDEIERVDAVEPLPLPGTEGPAPAGRNGDVRLVFSAGYAGTFRSCEQGHRSHINELAVYELDRLLRVHRVPATARRSIVWEELSKADISDDNLKRLQQVREQCHGSRRVLDGVVIGWTRFKLQSISPKILTEWFKNAHFDSNKPTQRLMEFSKLAIFLLMTGQPEKVTHGPVQEMFVPQVVNGKASDVVGTYFYVFVDNGEASFADDYGESKPATPVCARTKREAKFRCSVERWPDRSLSLEHQRKELNGILLSFLETACIFPKKIAEQLLHYGSMDPAQAISLTHELREALKNEGVDEPPSLHALGARLRHIFVRLLACVKTYGTDMVLKSEAIYDFVDSPPLVHYDPAGARFVYNAKTSRWSKDDHYDKAANVRHNVLRLAREELQERKALGLLRPSERELQLLTGNRTFVDKMSRDEYHRRFQIVPLRLPDPLTQERIKAIGAGSDDDSKVDQKEDYLALFGK